MAKRVIQQVIKQVICIGMVIIVLAPILLTLFASLKSKGAMTLSSPLLPPAGSDLTFENYKKVFTNKYLLIGFKNTIIILAVSLIFNVMLWEPLPHLSSNDLNSAAKSSSWDCFSWEC